MKTKLSTRIISIFLSIVLLTGCLPILAKAAPAGAIPAAVAVADPGSTAAWEDILGIAEDGSRYAGRVWVDKSVYTDGDTVVLDSQGNANSTFTVDVDPATGEYFQIVFSALGSSMSTNTTVYTSRPLDVVLVLDTSTSMTTSSGNQSRLQRIVTAANEMLEELLALGDVRVGIVTFNADSETVLPLASYDNGVILSCNHYTNTNGGGVISARNQRGTLLGQDSGYTRGTNLQDGIHRGMSLLANAANTAGRAPVAIVLADGRANHAVSEEWYNPAEENTESSGDGGILLSTLLNAAYGRTRVEKKYGTPMTVYGIGVDLDSSSNDFLYLNPGAEGNDGFNAGNSDESVESAWNAFQRWQRGNTATIQSGYGYFQSTFTFDHAWPASEGITTAEIAANINYVDNYQDVRSADLGEAFENILQELSTGAFNPISDTNNSATAIEDTPLIYVDNVGRYMEVRSIQALQVFGQTFPVTQESDGSYTIAAQSGVNPTTGESWNSGSDVRIRLLENNDGSQQLRVYVDQEILPILLDEISVTTENGVTLRSLEETTYPPLRLFYTVGIDRDILLPDGSVNVAKLDADYPYLNTDGTVDFYSNAFGNMNTADADGNGLVDQGDAHVGFVPSHKNRYYYHQAHQEIFLEATNADGSPILWDDDMYGVRWEEGKYRLTAMTAADLATVSDSDRVYTYVTFTRKTGSGNAAEEVTYLVYTTWGDIKSSITFYDKVGDSFLNGGSALDPASAGTAVNSYLTASGRTGSDLIAVLGLLSRRVSRLHNMFEPKQVNTTLTAQLAYAPAYHDSAHNTEDIHEHSEVIVWLGNNGKLTLPAGAGLQLTKALTATAEGASADEQFELYALLDTPYDQSLAAGLVATDTQGEALPQEKFTASESAGKLLLTFRLAGGESALVMGVPGGVNYTVTEKEDSRYLYHYHGESLTAYGKIAQGTVTNSPVLPGSLYITKEVVPYREGESFPTHEEFTFHVSFADQSGAPLANREFQLENNYDPAITSRTTDDNGVMTGWLRHGETVHILGIPDGTRVTVEEAALPANGNYSLKGYRSRDLSGGPADDDGSVTVTSRHNATVVVTNTYTPHPASASLDLTVEKTLHVDTLPAQRRDFSFTMEKWNEETQKWDKVGSDAALGWDASEITAGTDLVNTASLFSGSLGSFTEAGTAIYQIYEVIPENRITGMVYDRSVYTLTVTVKDEGGLLTVTVTDQDGNLLTDANGDGTLDFTAAFRNEENAAIVSIDIEKHVSDTSNNPEISAAGFEFVAQTAIVENGVWSVKPASEGGRSFSVYSDGVGEARMIDVYKEAGTYYYIISEKDSGKSGWDYSTTRFHVTVTVTKDAEDNLHAEMTIDTVGGRLAEQASVTDGTRGKIVFSNTYDPADAVLDLNVLVEKKLEGRALVGGEFTFAIFENGAASLDANGNLANLNAAVAIGTNDTAGKVTFTPATLSFSQLGRYEYDILEVKGNLGGVSYDPIIYDLVVEVTDEDLDGTLTLNRYFEDNVTSLVTFQNRYVTSPVSVTVNGSKTLKVLSGSKTLHSGDYRFGLYDHEGNKLQETENQAGGTFAFLPMEYTQKDVGKTFTYTVREIAPDGSTDGSYQAGGVRWSAQSFPVTVTVSDNGDGTLKATVVGSGSEMAFENVYESTPVTVTLPGKKNLENRPLTAGEFTFGLYRADRSFETLTPVNESITHDQNGDFSIPLGTLGEGEHYFVVKEIIPAVPAKGIHYSVAAYRITVTVTDHGNGTMNYTKTVVNQNLPESEASDITFTNVYRPEAAELPISGTKRFRGGKALEDGLFSIGLYDGEDQLVSTAKVQANGSFSFENLVFHAGDVGQSFLYTLREIIPEGATAEGDAFRAGNILYDGSVYELTVTVKDEEKDGVLELSSTLTKAGQSADRLIFTNTFIPNPVSHSIQAKKTYEKGLEGGDFRFRLTSLDAKTSVDQTKENAADGTILFDPILFAEAGEYSFKLTEKKDNLFSFILPSQAEYEILITVVNENGILRVSKVESVNVKNSGETDLNFVNRYLLDGQTSVNLAGTKLLSGRNALKDQEFTFALYREDGTLVETVQNNAEGLFAFTPLLFDETDVGMNEEKTFTYTVREVAGSDPAITYDKTVYTVRITVKDNDKGGIDASCTVNGEANTPITFTNLYTPPVNTDIPQTGDRAQLQLWMALLFVSGATLFTTTLRVKRKED